MIFEWLQVSSDLDAQVQWLPGATWLLVSKRHRGVKIQDPMGLKEGNS